MVVGENGVSGVAVLLAAERVSKWEHGSVTIQNQSMAARIVMLMEQKHEKRDLVAQVLVQVCVESSVVILHVVSIIKLSQNIRFFHSFDQ